MTDNEKLSCLIDRPCTACKFHKEEGCSKWSCVFEEKSDVPKGEYIKKEDALAELDKWEWQELYLPTHFKDNILDMLPTYSFPEREKGTDEEKDPWEYMDDIEREEAREYLESLQDFAEWEGGKE